VAIVVSAGWSTSPRPPRPRTLTSKTKGIRCLKRYVAREPYAALLLSTTSTANRDVRYRLQIHRRIHLTGHSLLRNGRALASTVAVLVGQPPRRYGFCQKDSLRSQPGWCRRRRLDRTKVDAPATVAPQPPCSPLASPQPASPCGQAIAAPSLRPDPFREAAPMSGKTTSQCGVGQRG
jgi:hypothetical protein